MTITLEANQTLGEYVLNYELSKACGISNTAYKFWKKTISAHFAGSRVVFLKRSTLPPKYANFASLCTDLSGLVLSNAFCAFCGLANSHLVDSNGSKLGEILKIRKIAGFKFVDLDAFYEYIKLPRDSYIYIDKCKNFAPEPLEKRIKLTKTLCLGYSNIFGD